jgi:hypothetical protein
MLGFNGGLLGKRNVATTAAASGIWFSNEQSIANRDGIWPSRAISARYWRVKSLVFSASDFFEISEWQLLDGANSILSGGITPTSSSSPLGGSLANLSDGSTANNVYWSQATAQGAGFWIKYDLGNPQIVSSVRFGSENTLSRAPTGGQMEWSSDNTNWTTLAAFSGLTYSGSRVLSSIVSINNVG